MSRTPLTHGSPCQGHRPFDRPAQISRRHHAVVRPTVSPRRSGSTDHRPHGWRFGVFGQRGRRQPEFRHRNLEQRCQGHHRYRSCVQECRRLHPGLRVLRLRAQGWQESSNSALRPRPRLGRQPRRAPRCLRLVAVQPRRPPGPAAWRPAGTQLGRKHVHSGRGQQHQSGRRCRPACTGCRAA